MSNEVLHSIGIKNIDRVESYTIRSEANQDILKVYYKKEKGDLFHRSEKLKFPREQKTFKNESGKYENTNEISSILHKAMIQLDKVTLIERKEKDVKKKIVADLRHLEQVVSNKIAEIEADLERLK
ncbi:Chromosome segregation ATPase [gamma proteobacterium IMCC1989]|nr:Chromosome segregation ATPase [gamma proteobacterium IMCC1989]